jgi:hypothetical protein
VARTPKATPNRVAGGTLYLVQRVYEQGWDEIFDNSAAAWDCPDRPKWGGPIKAFTTFLAADSLCKELTAKLLKGRNPFDLQGETLADLTSFPPGPFRDWLLDVGLKPLPEKKNSLEDWRQWWEKSSADTKAEQRRRVLTGLNKLRLYAVTELEPPARARKPPKDHSRVGVYSVCLSQFKDDGDYFAGLDSGWLASLEPCFTTEGVFLATFRDRVRADAYRTELQRRVPAHSRRFYRNGFRVCEHTIEVGD